MLRKKSIDFLIRPSYIDKLFSSVVSSAYFKFIQKKTMLSPADSFIVPFFTLHLLSCPDDMVKTSRIKPVAHSSHHCIVPEFGASVSKISPLNTHLL